MARMISTAFAYLSATILAALVCLICVNVALRYVFGAPIIWVDQITGYAIVYITFLGAPLVVAKRGHISVDVLQAALGRRGRLLLGALVGAAVSVYCLAFTALSWNELERILARNSQFNDAIVLPQWTVYWVLIAGGAMMALHFALQAVEDLRSYLAGETTPGDRGSEEEGRRDGMV